MACGSTLAGGGEIRFFVALDAQRLRRVRALELARQHAHADQVVAVDALEALGDDRLDAQKLRALGRPVARGSGTVFLAAEDHRRRALRDVLHRRVVDEQEVGQMSLR